MVTIHSEERVDRDMVLMMSHESVTVPKRRNGITIRDE